MKLVSDVCVDVGTKNCPCVLAETGECLVCGKLSDANKCDCRWTGLCIYNEYIQNGEKLFNCRRNKNAIIIEKKRYDKNLAVMILKVPYEIAVKSTDPGSFVFLNVEMNDNAWPVPVSVMKVDKENSLIHVAINVAGVKTKKLARLEKRDEVSIRGVYRNGIIGKGLKTLSKSGKWVIFTKGVGLAPAINLIDGAGEDISVKLYIDEDKICREFVLKYITELRAYKENKVKIRFCDMNSIMHIKADKYDTIFVFASDYYISMLAEKLNLPHEKLIVSNNFKMCCGEGVCGACSFSNNKGENIKMCKCRYYDIMNL